MQRVIISDIKTKRTKEVILAGIPRVNDHIQLHDEEFDAPQLIVDDILWTEGGVGPPTVVVTVHPHRPTL